MAVVDLRRLELLVELARLGSMRAVAAARGLTTSTVSQQIAALATEVGAAVIEPDGRRVRLTPAGRRLADHGLTILAAVDAARWDLDPDAEAVGTIRIGGFATAIRVSLLPILVDLAATHPSVATLINEYEPRDALRLLADDALDIALTYDFNLAPAQPAPSLDAVHLWSAPWGLGVRSGEPAGPADLGRFKDRQWIVNSGTTADEKAVRTLASMAGFSPQIRHQIDSLDLVEDLIVAGHGVALLPAGRRARPGIKVIGIKHPGVVLRAYAVTRRGRPTWPPLRLLMDELVPLGAVPTLPEWP